MKLWQKKKGATGRVHDQQAVTAARSPRPESYGFLVGKRKRHYIFSPKPENHFETGSSGFKVGGFFARFAGAGKLPTWTPKKPSLK
jgi:hypothetical protein